MASRDLIRGGDADTDGFAVFTPRRTIPSQDNPDVLLKPEESGCGRLCPNRADTKQDWNHESLRVSKQFDLYVKRPRIIVRQSFTRPFDLEQEKAPG